VPRDELLLLLELDVTDDDDDDDELEDVTDELELEDCDDALLLELDDVPRDELTKTMMTNYCLNLMNYSRLPHQSPL
jgi:hypothetical protein